MKNISSLCRLLAGLLLICLGSLAFVGCNDVTSLNGLVPSQLTGAIAPPKAAPAGTTMLITPIDPVTGLASGPAAAQQVAAISDGLSLSSPSMSFKASAPIGVTPAIVVKIVNGAGKTIGISSDIPLKDIGGTSIASDPIKLPTLPAGQSYVIDLAPGTLVDVANLVAGQTRAANVPAGLQVPVMTFVFDVTVVGGVVKSTLPTEFNLQLTRVAGEDLFMLADSMMTVSWIGGSSTAPTNGFARLTLTRYIDGVQKGGIVSQRPPVVQNVVTYLGVSNTKFNQVDIVFNAANNNL